MYISEVNKHKIINFLFLFLPLSFIAGNTFINTNIILLIIISLIFFHKRIFLISINIYDKILLAFFLVVLFSGVLNSYLFYFPEESMYAKEILVKSFLFLRFVLVYFILRYLIQNNILIMKYFFISAALCSLFVTLDVILQFITGRDIFGYENFDRRNPGPFKDEAVSGAYLQRFSLFSFFLFPIFFQKIKKDKYFIFLIPIFFLTFCAVLFSGNKFPFVMFALSIVILFFLIGRFKKLSITLLIICPLVFIFSYKYSFQVQNNFSSFFNNISQIKIYVTNVAKNFKNVENIEVPNVWLKEMHVGMLAFEQKKIFGGGLKSYKVACPRITQKYSCNTHPHNFHVEILVSTGIIGYLLLLILFLKFTYSLFIKNYYSYKKNDQLLLNLFFTLFFIEVFPFRTTGSFFSTTNATYFFIIMSITISLSITKIVKNK